MNRLIAFETKGPLISSPRVNVGTAARNTLSPACAFLALTCELQENGNSWQARVNRARSIRAWSPGSTPSFDALRLDIKPALDNNPVGVPATIP